jgi:hypothetical protein
MTMALFVSVENKPLPLKRIPLDVVTQPDDFDGVLRAQSYA